MKASQYYDVSQSYFIMYGGHEEKDKGEGRREGGRIMII